MKCKVCKHAEAEWAWQPWGPGNSHLSFTVLGSHYRGFPVVKVCDFCKREAIENAKESGKPVRFSFTGGDYVFDGERVPFVEYLWNGGTSGDMNGDFEMICRGTPTGHDIVAVVYTAVAPGLADEIIEAYNRAHRSPGCAAMSDGDGYSGMFYAMLLVGIIGLLGFIAVAGSVP